MYSFAGFFARPQVPQPDTLPADAVWRVIDKPFSGVGVRIPELLGTTPDVTRVEGLARQLGLAEVDWLFLT